MASDETLSSGSDRHKRLPPECEAPGCCAKPRARVGGYALCGKHGQRYSKHGAFDLPAKPEKAWAVCTVDGCDEPARTRLGALCEKHYYRRYRTGDFSDPSYKRRYVMTNGYVRLVGVDCEISNGDGAVMEHRKVLFDAIGFGPHKCHWCGKGINWAPGRIAADTLVVDHLNGVKDDNRVENLVASCQRCNSARGLFLHWVHEHRDDPYLRAVLLGAQSTH